MDIIQICRKAKKQRQVEYNATIKIQVYFSLI